MMLWLIAVGLVSAGFFLWPRFRVAGSRFASTFRASDVSVIIPARNEAHNLPTLLQSLRTQSIQPREILVVDDNSNDGTAEVARAFGATVIASQPLPEGWRGKTWACQQGARAASGALLLFLDADTWLEPGGLARVLALYRGGAFSVAPFHAVRRLYEDLSLFFNLNMAAGILPSGLFGPMLLVGRHDYEAAGGHAAVKSKVLENVHLAARFRELGIAVGSIAGRGVLAFRMYPLGLRELIQGWSRGFVSGAGQTATRTMSLIVIWMSGLLLPPLGLLFLSQPLWWAMAWVVCAVQVGWLARHVGSFSWMATVLYPAPLLFFLVVFAWAAVRPQRKVTWKGREFHAG